MPPNKVDITDINIYKTIGHNYVTVVVVAAMWSIYLSLVIWARSRDKKDIRKVGAGTMPAILLLIILCNMRNLIDSTVQRVQMVKHNMLSDMHHTADVV